MKHERPTARTRVLLIDEHFASRKAVAVMLRVEGFECIAVATVDEAFTSLETFMPDVIILEWAFRGAPSEGRGLAERLRNRSLRLGKAVPVIVTSHVDEPPAFREQEAIEAYLVKPVAPHILVSAITAAVASR